MRNITKLNIHILYIYFYNQSPNNIQNINVIYKGVVIQDVYGDNLYMYINKCMYLHIHIHIKILVLCDSSCCCVTVSVSVYVCVWIGECV